MTVSTNDVQVGDTLRLKKAQLAMDASGNRRRTIPAGEPLEVRQVGTYKIKVRYDGLSFWLEALDLYQMGDDYVPPRAIGVVPEGSIPPDDPRLAYLWEDAEKLAKEAGYCPTYDRLCDQLGIPGRVRKFNVSLTRNGVDFTATVDARSNKEARAKAEQAMLADG